MSDGYVVYKMSNYYVTEDRKAVREAADYIDNGPESRTGKEQESIRILTNAKSAIQRMLDGYSNRKPEPIGIGPGGYDPTKDPDITGV